MVTQALVGNSAPNTSGSFGDSWMKLQINLLSNPFWKKIESSQIGQKIFSTTDKLGQKCQDFLLMKGSNLKNDKMMQLGVNTNPRIAGLVLSSTGAILSATILMISLAKIMKK